MNLLEFPNEILFEFCKHMDFYTRVSFRKVCKQTNHLLDNPRHIVTKEKVDEWNEKTKTILGMTLLDNIGEYIFLRSPSINEKYIRLAIDETYEFYMTINYGAIPFMRNFKMSSERYNFIEGGGIIMDHTLFSKYKLQNHTNIFDEKEDIGYFLYDLYISFLAQDQKKNKERVTKTQLSIVLKNIIDQTSKIYPMMTQIYKDSSYFVFPSEIYSQSFFKMNINHIAKDLQSDLLRYFMDGDEAEQFLRSYQE